VQGWLSWAILWENFAPVFNPVAIKDAWDVLCYCLGGMIYYLISNVGKKME
jgi:hypothetical protein